jgi:hypothetical protein
MHAYAAVNAAAEAQILGRGSVKRYVERPVEHVLVLIS